jgi:hypothetical protein
MSESTPPAEKTPAQAFRRLLKECQRLYRECAQDYAERNPELVHDSPGAFVARMVELHRGLVLKVFAEIALAGHPLSAEELELAQELFEHAWGKRLSEEQVKETLLHYSETTHLRWESLLGPFERLSSFRRRATDLQALVLRLARAVAKAHGKANPRIARQLQWVKTEVQRVVQRVPVAGLTPPETVGRQAAQVREGDFEITPSGAGGEEEVKDVQLVEVQSLEEILEELDTLIGLDSIKHDVRELVNFLRMQEERKKFGLPETSMSLHAVFTGNPGTGKTTVARIYGRLLGALGLLARGHLIETDRSGLVAEYAGQTAPKTMRRIDEALDGVLFIDEAYSLVADAGEDPYGMEALQTLLKRMEDDRGRLVVILAGYPRPMERLLRTNPGLSSRVGRTFAFPDYTAVELGRIFEAMCRRDHYRLPGRARAKLLLGFGHLLAGRDEHFGNGRLARNVFERSVRALANRLAAVQPLTRELLTTMQVEDVVLEGVPAASWTGLGEERPSFRLSCPGCGAPSTVPPKYLGRTIKCPRCAGEFEADWGEPPAGDRA